MLPVIAFLLIVAVSAESGDDHDCTLPSQSGLCQAYIPSYFFNVTTGQCEQFIYGGCGGNSNRFRSKKECDVVCQPEDAVDCNADPEVGMCQAIIPRFFYDRVTKECKNFVYGGCGGNSNNFKSFDECRDQCGAVAPRDGPDCSSPAETGLCRAYFPRFFFNTESGRCEKFVYGGCGGNDNSYGSEEHCQKSCGGVKEDHTVDCHAEPETGLCDAYFPMYHYDSATRSCKKFVYGGCGGNTNRFATEEQCMNQCHHESEDKIIFKDDLDCESEAETGLCKAYIPMYHYDKATKTCSQFIYGGCGGNGNRFITLDQCMQSCHVKEEEEVDENPIEEEVLCDAKPETGMCRGYFPMYYYNTEKGSCDEFVYGGCGGNTNRFENEEDCFNRCGIKEGKVFRRVQEVDCDAAPETGMCRGSFPMYYFNRVSETCEEFIYGGCGGNSNRFGSEEECLGKCNRKEERKIEIDCESEPETGLCMAYFPSYNFNKKTGTCEKFIYGGCGGNGNRFRSEKECLATCSV